MRRLSASFANRKRLRTVLSGAPLCDAISSSLLSRQRCNNSVWHSQKRRNCGLSHTLPGPTFPPLEHIPLAITKVNPTTRKLSLRIDHSKVSTGVHPKIVPLCPRIIRNNETNGKISLRINELHILVHSILPVVKLTITQQPPVDSPLPSPGIRIVRTLKIRRIALTKMRDNLVPLLPKGNNKILLPHVSKSSTSKAIQVPITNHRPLMTIPIRIGNSTKVENSALTIIVRLTQQMPMSINNLTTMMHMRSIQGTIPVDILYNLPPRILAKFVDLHFRLEINCSNISDK